jgi:hypothetical protein
LKSPLVQVEISALVGALVILFVFLTGTDDETAPPLMTEAIFHAPRSDNRGVNNKEGGKHVTPWALNSTLAAYIRILLS